MSHERTEGLPGKRSSQGVLLMRSISHERDVTLGDCCYQPDFDVSIFSQVMVSFWGGFFTFLHMGLLTTRIHPLLYAFC